MEIKKTCFSLSAILCCICIPGCTFLRLQHSITNQATTLADIHYQQVLNNLALFSTNPNFMPSHVSLRDGSAQIQDFGQANAGLDITESVTTSLGLTGSRTVVEQWGVSPITDDIEVRIIQIAYQRAIGIPAVMDFDLANDLARELSKQTAETSDIDQRNERASTNRFREQFATLATPEEVAKYKSAGGPNAQIDQFQRSILRNSAFDYFALINVIGTNSKNIILEEEFEQDQTLKMLDPAVATRLDYPKLDTTKYFTPLAQYARREVKDVQEDLEKIEPGWFHTGPKYEISKDACYIGKYKGHYAWVCPSGIPAHQVHNQHPQILRPRKKNGPC